MLRWVGWFRKRFMVKMVAAVLVVFILLAAQSIFIQVQDARKAVEETIARYGMRMASSYAGQMDISRIGQFMQNETENDLYWSIRGELDRYRNQIGARYVYLVRIDDKGQPLIMIDGQPKGSDSASPIGEVTDVPADAAEALLKGETASSPLIDNPTYGKYISTYAPIKGADGKVMAILGIDTDAEVVSTLAGEVIRSSAPLYGWMLALMALGLALIVFLLARALRPLRHMATAAESIASGDLQGAGVMLSRHPVRSADEVGAVYRAMVNMSSRMNEIIGELVRAMSKTTEQVAQTTERFAVETRQLLDMNTRIDASVREVTAGMGVQQTSTQECATGMEEMSAAVQRVSSASLALYDASDSALHNAESGKAVVRQMSSQIGAIAESTQEAAERVAALRSYSEEIEDALRAIREISDQTKLLALNASIEAARAGEHGAGFAVVAAQVRKLAEDASGSTGRIADLLLGIRNETSGIASAMDGGIREVGEGQQLSVRAEASFANIVEMFRNITEQIHEVSSAAEQMSAGSEEVAASAGGIADIAHSVSASTAEISGLVQEQLVAVRGIAESAAALSDATQEMRIAVSGIKV